MKLNKLLLFAFLICSGVMLSKPLHLEVSQDGKSPFTSINQAIQAAPQNAKEATVVYIKKGIYREKVFIDRPNIVLLGEDRKETQIVAPILYEKWDKEYKAAHPDGQGDVRWGCAVINIHERADDCALLNLTAYNNYGSTIEKTRNHQFCVFGRATRTIILNCDILSDGSDDLSLWSRKEGMYYHADCYFRCPGVDFVCPRGWCFIENSIFDGAAPAQIWHDGGDTKEKKFVLRNCRFEAKEKSWLGRFHKDSQFYLLDCTFSEMIKDDPIGYAYKDKPMNLRWGKRVYYYNCRRDGETFEWMRNNLHQAEGSPNPEIITPAWTFDGKWDPMPTVEMLRRFFKSV